MGNENPVLVIQNDSGNPIRHLSLTNQTYIVGRGEECDIVLHDRQVSRQHVRIFERDNCYWVEDLGSKNGTWVNGKPLKSAECQVGDGDEIYIASVIRMRFSGSDATRTTDFSSFLAGRLRLDAESHRVFVEDKEVDPPLSLPQYRLLELLYVNAGHVCTREQVVEAVWPDVIGEGVSEQAIDALVRRLRDRLAEIDADHQFILTVRGHGFRLDNSPAK